MQIVGLMNHLFLILIISILSCVSSMSHAQEISNGTYIGHKLGLVPKYMMLEVNDDTINFEIFARWQGSWVP